MDTTPSRSTVALPAPPHCDMSLDEAIRLAVKCIASTIEGKVSPRMVRVAVIPVKTRTFRFLTEEEVKKYLP